MKKITLLLILLTVKFGFSQNSVTVATSQAWNAYVNAFNVSDGAYAFGFAYTVSDLRATPTATSMTLEPNTAIWTAEATNAGWFDQGATTQTANKYIEALSYIEDASLANEELTFSGNVSVSDLGDGYTVVAFIKTLTSSYSTVAYKTADISSTGDFTITATADEMSQAVIQYGFAVTGPLADPADTSLGSVVVGAEAPPASGNDVTVATSQAWNAYVNAFNVSDDAFAFGFAYTVSDLRATPTATSMTLEPNTAIWTAEATNAGWFDQGATTQTANKYIEALSYIEDASLANEELTFSGNVSVSDLGDGYTVVAFIKTLTSSYSTVAYKTADISSTGDFTVTATADEMSQAVIQYGFSVTGPLADPADTSLGSVVVGTEAPPASGNDVTVATSQAWNAYVNAFNVSDDAFAFGFAYTVSDLRATPTATSMTLEPNTAIWTAEATNAGWFDQGATTQTANKYIEALSYIEDASLANEELTFSGNVSVSDLGDGYTVVAFIKTLTSGYSTVAYKTADISSTGDFTVTATADEMSQAVIQYGFAVTGPLADPADTSLGSVVVGTEAPPASGNDVTVATSQAWNAYVNAFNVSDGAYAFGFAYTVSDLRATPTATSMTLEPNTAIWTAEATNAGWFDQGATTQTANKYIEALSYIEDASLANEELTFSGNVSVSDLGDGYTVVAFIKTAYVNAFNVSDGAYAFGFAYTVSDLRATPTATSMTLEPNTAIWTAEATNAAWFDQGATTQTANKYIEALSYIEDASLANEELTFSGNVSVSDLGDGYTVVAFIKTLTSSYSTVAYKTADISSTGDFTITATADEMSQAVIQYGFAVTGPLADPADTTLGSVVIGAETLSVEDTKFINVSVYPNPSSSNWNFRTPNTVIKSVEVFNLLGKRVASQRNNNSTEASISTQGLTNGIYIARITTEQGAKSVKLIKN